MSKAEDSKAQNKERFLRELIWERQKKEEEAARIASEMRRRRMLAEENRAKNLKKVNSTFSSVQTNTDTFTNSVDPDEMAHNKLSHQDLHCLSFY